MDYAGSTSHYLAYYGMFGKNQYSACDSPPQPVGLRVQDECGSDDEVVRILAGLSGASRRHRRFLTESVVNAECSNSAWP
jgi:hypothetical protein